MSYKYEIRSSDGYGMGSSLSSLAWTTNTPTMSGIFFARRKKYPNIFCVEFDADDNSAYLHGECLSCPSEEFTHWLGPLPVPESPTGQ